jgi:D-serine deaminase-like pyridoxal phosphate-dependent protein
MDKRDWYSLRYPDSVDSPALLVYPDRILSNIREMIRIAGTAERLMPHVKTHKMASIVHMQLQEGISKFKCATIAEAEMVASCGSSEVLLAYQLTRPRAIRWIQLIRQYPQVRFASLLDNLESARLLDAMFAKEELTAEVFIDVDEGMHRTGCPAGPRILQLYREIQSFRHLVCRGLHVYDGHIRESDFESRKKSVQEAFLPVADMAEAVAASGKPSLMIVAGGTPSFTVHALNPSVTCSPGTCVLWDAGYDQMLQEQDFQFAAVLMMRVSSVPMEGRITLDLGHKAVAAENPMGQRLRFLDRDGWKVISQSEEHLVVELPVKTSIPVGEVVYGVPYHVCPTVALYDEVQVVDQGMVTGQWPVTARGRRISI